MKIVIDVQDEKSVATAIKALELLGLLSATKEASHVQEKASTKRGKGKKSPEPAPDIDDFEEVASEEEPESEVVEGGFDDLFPDEAEPEAVSLEAIREKIKELSGSLGREKVTLFVQKMFAKLKVTRLDQIQEDKFTVVLDALSKLK